jgi:hypothetical protein
MNRDEAKDILQLYRQHTADAQDPQVAAALELARRDPELAGWLEMHCAREFVLSEKFRQIPVPEGLKEQIISEHAASRRAVPQRRQLVLAVAALVMLLGAGTMFWLNNYQPPTDTLKVFQSQMAAAALSGYAMSEKTNDVDAVRAYLKGQQSPSDYELPAPLQHVAQSGCTVEGWNGGKVSMVCFLTDKPHAPGVESDLWLFVADAKSVKHAPDDATPRIATVGGLVTATWVKDGKLYFLGLAGDESELKKFL